jgi:hypothetical protein
MINELLKCYQNRIIQPKNAEDIQNNTWYVYILFYNNSPIVLGQGRRNRAKVIFDNFDTITSGHYKALLVRLYKIYGEGKFSNFLIKCSDESESKKIEKELHKKIGGTGINILQEIMDILFQDIVINSSVWIYIKLALLSSYDGLSDLKKWRREGIINDSDWNIISKKLNLNYP